MRQLPFAILSALLLLGVPALRAQPKSMPEDAKVYILWPPDGAVIRGAFWVRMGLSGAGVAPAGVERAGTGHHHILVDTPLPKLDEPIPNDRNHLHFGLGQTEARLDLPAGKHTHPAPARRREPYPAPAAALLQTDHRHGRAPEQGGCDDRFTAPAPLGLRGLPLRRRAGRWRNAPAPRRPRRRTPTSISAGRVDGAVVGTHVQGLVRHAQFRRRARPGWTRPTPATTTCSSTRPCRRSTSPSRTTAPSAFRPGPDRDDRSTCRPASTRCSC